MILSPAHVEGRSEANPPRRLHSQRNRRQMDRCETRRYRNYLETVL